MREGWTTRRLGEIGECRIGLTYSPEDVCNQAGTLVLRSSNVRQGRIVYDDNVFVSSTVAESARVREGDILICVRNGSRALIGKSARINAEASEHAFGAFMAVFRSPMNDYVYQLLQTDEFTRQVHATLGATINQITNADLRSFQFAFPPSAEQRKIVEILTTWDEAIEKLEALRLVKDTRLSGLRSSLLFGKMHLNRRRGKWQHRRIGEVTHEITTRNNGEALGRNAVMGVTNDKGIVPMREQTIAGDISRYKRLPPRAFAYNPMRINVGSIAMNAGNEEVLVSPDYVVFGCNADGLDPDYFDHLRRTQWWNHYVNSGGSGSVRMRTYYDDLAALKVALPQLDEQRSLAQILNTAQRDVELTINQIEALRRQKRGLMQKLLTGEWQVTGDESAAQEREVAHA